MKNILNFVVDLVERLFNTDERVILGSGFGLGLIPFAPGSFGTLIGVVIHWMTHYCIKVNFQYLMLFYLLLLTCIMSLLTSDYCSMYWESSDPKQFIIDEIAGYLLTVLIIGDSLNKYNAPFWKHLVVAFVLFRLCDIVKLPGAKYIDKNIHNKWGILLDDLVSAIYAGGVLRFLSIFNI